MPSPLHGLRPPYTLPSNIVYFHDWRYVQTGGFGWASVNGEPTPMWTRDPVPQMRLNLVDMPRELRLEAQPATKTEPVLTPDQAATGFLLGGGNLIHEDGVYRLWYECWSEDDIGTESMGMFDYMRYAESTDGIDWKLPNIGLIEYRGSLANNIVIGPSLTPETGFHGGCIFRDPSAPAEERYKTFHLGRISPDALEKYRSERPDEIDPFHLDNNPVALYGGVSPDGFHWTPLPDPLVVQTSDTHNICEYDAVRGKYVAYCRSWYFQRRTVGRMETDDFRRFPLPEELIWPNAMMKPYETWYANAKTMIPGTSDYHIMFPMRWSLPEDKFDFHLATSPDGMVWGFVPGGPLCEVGESGAWDAGVVGPGLGMVRLPGQRMGILFTGSPVPHKHPRRAPLGALAWAWWPEGRLVALKAPHEESFALWPLKFRGRTVHLNFRTAPAGFIQVEAIGPDKELDGRTFADCDYLSGNHLDKVVTWRGESDLGHPADAPVKLRFRMRSAELYSVEFK